MCGKGFNLTVERSTHCKKKKYQDCTVLCMLIYDFLDHGYNIGALKVHCYTFTKYW